MIRGRKHDKSHVFSIHLYLLFICFPSQGYHFCSFLPSLSFFLFLSYSVCVGVQSWMCRRLKTPSLSHQLEGTTASCSEYEENSIERDFFQYRYLPTGCLKKGDLNISGFPESKIIPQKKQRKRFWNFRRFLVSSLFKTRCSIHLLFWN